jgi:ribosomal protein S18 acetylase RimI-like enzyme
MVEVVYVQTATDLEQVRALFQEYADKLGVDLCFQDFAKELDTLPGKYAAPEGCLLLARDKGKPVGCVALRPTDKKGICEMKRLYVQPEHRKVGLGRWLATQIIREAQEHGYEKMRLDTLDSMKEAQALYRALGFVDIPAYYNNPQPHTVFMERDLRKPLSTPATETKS